MNENTLNTLMCAEYEDILAGNRKSFSNAILKKYNNSKYYVPMLRFVFENMLGWTPEDVKLYISMDVLRALKLEQVIGLLEIPTEIDLEQDSFYLAHILYPDLYPYDFTTAILTEYKRKTGDEEGNIKKGFFDDEKGRYAARICLRYAIEQDLPIITSEKIYEFFADETKANQFINDHRLRNGYLIHYESPLEYLHDALLPPMRCELYYWFYIFKNQFDSDKKVYRDIQRKKRRERYKNNAGNGKRKHI